MSAPLLARTEAEARELGAGEPGASAAQVKELRDDSYRAGFAELVARLRTAIASSGR